MNISTCTTYIICGLEDGPRSLTHFIDGGTEDKNGPVLPPNKQIMEVKLGLKLAVSLPHFVYTQR